MKLLERRNLLVGEKPDFRKVGREEMRAISKAGKPVEEKYRSLEGEYNSEEALMEAVKKYPEVSYRDGRLSLGRDGGIVCIKVDIATVRFIGG